MKFLVIGDRDTIAGFSLIGIEGIVVNTKSEALKALKYAIHNKDIAIILITERVAGEIRNNIDNLISHRKKCNLILQIPDAHRSKPMKHTVEEFIFSALGIKV
ncbi:MAG: V-type ATP synthase subunit F [bacterium]